MPGPRLQCAQEHPEVTSQTQPASDGPAPGATTRLDHTALAPLIRAIAADVQPTPRLLDQPDAWPYLGLSRSEWFRLRAAGELPDPVQMPGRKLPMWRAEDLDKWPRRLKPAR